MNELHQEAHQHKGSAIIGILMIAIVVVAIAILIFKKKEDIPSLVEKTIQKEETTTAPEEKKVIGSTNETSIAPEATPTTTGTAELSASDEPDALETDLNNIDMQSLDSDIDNWE